MHTHHIGQSCCVTDGSLKSREADVTKVILESGGDLELDPRCPDSQPVLTPGHCTSPNPGLDGEGAMDLIFKFNITLSQALPLTTPASSPCDYQRQTCWSSLKRDGRHLTLEKSEGLGLERSWFQSQFHVSAVWPSSWTTLILTVHPC